MKINLLEYLQETVKCASEKIAVKENSREITFKQLNQKAKALATYLLQADANIINKPIAVYLPKGIECVISDIAIMYSGNVYMNLDVKSPKQRICNIIDHIMPAYIITTEQYSLDFLENQVKVICIESVCNESEIDAEGIKARMQKLVDTDPLCIINTSGSTGTPKGVVLNHRSFIDFTEQAIEVLNIGKDEKIGSLSPAIFDIFSFELCMLMAKSNTIIIIPDSLSAFPSRILQILADDKVTFIFWVPTIMVNIANMDLLKSFDLSALKLVLFAGEVFPTKQFNYWRKILQEAVFVNMYGPIEITLDCTYYIVKRDILDDEPIPIGYAFKNTDVLLLKENDTLAGKNEDGEICIRGTSLAMGYYNNPEKTAAAFVQNPLNQAYPELIYRTGDIGFINALGEIVFKGRKDSLVKHLGYRIELSEIEHIIINSLKLVKNCCIVYNFKEKQIVLIYEDERDLPIAEMRRAILTVLPKYMVPTVYIKMEELPRNPNGKIDRNKLKEKIVGE